MAFCPNCGKEITDSTKFCPECGKPIDSDDKVREHLEVKEQPETTSADKKNDPNSPKNVQKRMIRMVLGLLIFIGVLSIVIKLYAIGISFLAVGVICLFLSFPKEKRETFLKKTPKPILCAILAVVVCAFAFPFVKDGLSSSKHGLSNRTSSKSSITDITSDPFINPWLSLESHSVEAGRYGTKIIGVVSTNDIGNVTINSGAIIYVKFYDKDGNILAEKFDTSTGLKDGDRWKFEVIVPVNTAEYEITSVDVRD